MNFMKFSRIMGEVVIVHRRNAVEERSRSRSKSCDANLRYYVVNYAALQYRLLASPAGVRISVRPPDAGLVVFAITFMRMRIRDTAWKWI